MVLSIVKICQNLQVQCMLCWFCFIFIFNKFDPILLTALKNKYLISFVLFLTEISARLLSLLRLETKLPENKCFCLDSSKTQMSLVVEGEGKIYGATSSYWISKEVTFPSSCTFLSSSQLLNLVV